CRAIRARLRDRANPKKRGESSDVRAARSTLLRARNLRNRLAGCQRASLQHEQYWSEYPFGHALRHQQASKGSMKSVEDLHQELRQRILGLPGVTERQNAGIHEDAFLVGRTMFMHIHGQGHCDIRLSEIDQRHVLAQGRACPHRWAPEKGYVT